VAGKKIVKMEYEQNNWPYTPTRRNIWKCV